MSSFCLGSASSPGAHALGIKTVEIRLMERNEIKKAFNGRMRDNCPISYGSG